MADKKVRVAESPISDVFEGRHPSPSEKDWQKRPSPRLWRRLPSDRLAPRLAPISMRMGMHVSPLFLASRSAAFTPRLTCPKTGITINTWAIPESRRLRAASTPPVIAASF